MATQKLTVTAQAALDLLARRNTLPTLDWALAHPNRLTAAKRHAWDRELQVIDAALDAVEPSLPEDWWIGARSATRP